LHGAFPNLVDKLVTSARVRHLYFKCALESRRNVRPFVQDDNEAGGSSR
jgi:hypothetical protein